MLKLLSILAGSVAALALGACTSGALVGGARPGDRVVCDVRPNFFYLVGPNSHLTDCVEVPRREPPAAEAVPEEGSRSGRRMPRDGRLRPGS